MTIGCGISHNNTIHIIRDLFLKKIGAGALYHP
jgi:hypothetical protein